MDEHLMETFAPLAPEGELIAPLPAAMLEGPEMEREVPAVEHPEHVVRILEEHADLVLKLTKLQGFADAPEKMALLRTNYDRELLMAQLEVMSDYVNVLAARLRRADCNA